MPYNEALSNDRHGVARPAASGTSRQRITWATWIDRPGYDIV